MSENEVQDITQNDMQEFVDKYQKLCEDYGYRIVVTPAFKARDDGTWSIVQQTSVGKMPQDN